MTTMLDWLLAFSPILTVLVLMLGLRWGGSKAGPAAWLVALAVAALRFGAGVDVLWVAQGKGLLLSFYVLYIIWPALLFYQVTNEAGAVKAIGSGLSRLAPEKALQALLLGWGFASFLQSVGGYGVPVAVVAPLLVALGFPALVAVVLVSVGHAWSISFGSMGASVSALLAATGLPAGDLMPWSAALMGLVCLLSGASALGIAGGRSALRSQWPAILLMGLPMVVVQYVSAAVGMWAVAGLLASLVGLACGFAWARLSRGVQPSEGQPQPGAIALGWALLPYALLIAMVLLVELVPPVGGLLGQAILRVPFPAVATARGWETPAEVGRTIEVFAHAGALLLYASVVTFAVLSWRRAYRPDALRRIGRGVVKQAGLSTIGIVSMVGMALTMEHAGMTHVLAEGIARVSGVLFPLASPFIGVLGAFMTGSNTNSNVVFANLQMSVAALLNVSVPVILAAQTAGGAIGSVFAPAKVIVGCSTVGLGGAEGAVMRRIMVFGLAFTLVVALVALVAVMLIGGTG